MFETIAVIGLFGIAAISVAVGWIKGRAVEEAIHRVAGERRALADGRRALSRREVELDVREEDLDRRERRLDFRELQQFRWEVERERTERRSGIADDGPGLSA